VQAMFVLIWELEETARYWGEGGVAGQGGLKLGGISSAKDSRLKRTHEGGWK